MSVRKPQLLSLLCLLQVWSGGRCCLGQGEESRGTGSPVVTPHSLRSWPAAFPLCFGVSVGSSNSVPRSGSVRVSAQLGKQCGLLHGTAAGECVCAC